MIAAGTTLFFIGLALIGGAIETGTGYCVSALICIGGFVLLQKGLLDEAREKNRRKYARRNDYYEFAKCTSKREKRRA